MNKNRNTLFSPTMKMVDVILGNYALLTILPRFGINLGFGEKTVGDVCRDSGVEGDFFALICNVYTFSDYMPTTEELLGINISSLVEYLQNSHRYYRDEKIASIEQKLENMGTSDDGNCHQIINRFFSEYKNEIINHFNYEENTVFPYIKSLMTGHRIATNFNINQYEHNHSNIEDKLSDLKNIVIKYLPASFGSTLRTQVLFEIFLFEDDLTKHALIEDKILIPIVSQIEKCHE